ncbi:MAG: hypothetical protein F4203_05765 [Rhodobacteraceae bacterium]|nr:hypothetical protein [Paracoccaceae bacterium]
MSEFSNRIDSQRKILKTVNKIQWQGEPLLSLSQRAINRFTKANQLAGNSDIVRLLTQVSGKLFFLANKSQEQVTEEYQALVSEVMVIHNNIREVLAIDHTSSDKNNHKRNSLLSQN